MVVVHVEIIGCIVDTREVNKNLKLFLEPTYNGTVSLSYNSIIWIFKILSPNGISVHNCLIVTAIML